MAFPLVYPDHVYTLVRGIVDAACDCLEETPSGRPEMCFVSHNEPASDCCDSLAIWVESIRPSRGFDSAQWVTGAKLWDRCDNIGAVVDLGIRLYRPCFPTLVDNPYNPFPGEIEMDDAAHNLLIDAWVLRCCLTTLSAENGLLPDTCLEIAWGDMLPYGPEGGCAGWTWHITIETDTCC